MTVRLLLDEMYPPALADVLNQRGHDIVAVAAMPDLIGADDPTVLDAATTDRRCLVTENVADFAVLVRHSSHHGVLFVHPRRWPRTPKGIHRLSGALDKAIVNDQIPTVDNTGWLI